MIPCPSCGTRNRRGSRYCYRCGQPLDIVFNVSCPACDRLNPGGSAFCAFCGAKIVGLPPAEELAAVRPAVAEQPAQAAHEPRKERGTEYRPLASEPKSVEPPAKPQRELPPWLYEQPVQPPEVQAPPSASSSRAAAEPPLEQSKYLTDIPGALPKMEGWLASVPKAESKPATDRAPQVKPKAQGGCLMLPLLALFAAVGLVLMSAM